MYLEKLAEIIYEEGTASANRQITVKHHQERRILWQGKAKELKNMKSKWIVVEILIDQNDNSTTIEGNKAKIITVE